MRILVSALACGVAIGLPLVADASPRAAAADAPLPFIPEPQRDLGAALARIDAGTDVTLYPGMGPKFDHVGLATGFSRQPQTLLAIAAARVDGVDYVRVLLPIRPNGSVGWVPLDKVEIHYTHYFVVVKLRAHLVLAYRSGKRVGKFRAVIGKGATPTPTGLAAIYEKNRQPDPDAFLGPWALPLTILSNSLKSYGGGPGRIGIHGRSGASLSDSLGSNRSHGCIRIGNKAIRLLARRLPRGTPVQIHG